MVLSHGSEGQGLPVRPTSLILCLTLKGQMGGGWRTPGLGTLWPSGERGAFPAACKYLTGGPRSAS